MAARRLVIIMLVLLGVSALLAALLPDPSSRGTRRGTESTATEATTGTETTAAEEQPTEAPPEFKPGSGSGEDEDGDGITEFRIEKDKIKVVPAKEGEQVRVEVTAYPGMPPDLLEIPDLGLIDPISQDKPVIFDFYADEPGTFGIRLVETDTTVGRVVVEKP